MADQKRQPPDDPSTAPESGTVRDETSGNQPAQGGERGLEQRKSTASKSAAAHGKDDPSMAGEER